MELSSPESCPYSGSTRSMFRVWSNGALRSKLPKSENGASMLRVIRREPLHEKKTKRIAKGKHTLQNAQETEERKPQTSPKMRGNHKEATNEYKDMKRDL